MKPQNYIAAARVPLTLEPQEFGLWTIMRNEIQKPGLLEFVPRTILFRQTLATLHQPPGDVVMEDSDKELRTHLPIWMRGHGRVLITGLGLGCVVRGLLASPHIEHIDVVEIDADIIRVVGAEFVDNPRVTIHHGDALSYQFPDGTKWDCAWHDLWCEGEPHLQVLHSKLIMRFHKAAERQGAWQFPKDIKRRCGRMMLK